MEAWWMCEVPYPHVPKAVLDEADSVRASLPNRYCDPRIAADLFEEAIDEYLLCDEMGLNVCATEHHAGINSLLGANPMLDQLRARAPDALGWIPLLGDGTANYAATGHGALVVPFVRPAPQRAIKPPDCAAGWLPRPFDRTPGELACDPWLDYAKSFVGGTAVVR